eukprot:9180268-Karenia_brevis.AAC.1
MDSLQAQGASPDIITKAKAEIQAGMDALLLPARLPGTPVPVSPDSHAVQAQSYGKVEAPRQDTAAVEASPY